MKAHDDQLRNDPDFNPEFNQLIVGGEAIAIDASFDQLKANASYSPFSPKSRRAFIARSPYGFGMGRMASTLIELSTKPSDVRVFTDLPSALQWIGLSEDSIDLSAY
jgi:hypothetical protein